MQRKISLAIVSSFIFLGCSQVPPKPNVKLCTIDLPRQQLICADTQEVRRIDQTTYKAIYNHVRINTIQKIPLSDADKFIVFSPQDWQKVSVYMKTLRDFAQSKADQCPMLGSL